MLYILSYPFTKLYILYETMYYTLHPIRNHLLRFTSYHKPRTTLCTYHKSYAMLYNLSDPLICFTSYKKPCTTLYILNETIY